MPSVLFGPSDLTVVRRIFSTEVVRKNGREEREKLRTGWMELIRYYGFVNRRTIGEYVCQTRSGKLLVSPKLLEKMMGHTSSIRADFYSIGAFDWGASSTVCQCLSAHFGHLQISLHANSLPRALSPRFAACRPLHNDRAPPCKAPPNFVFDKNLWSCWSCWEGPPELRKLAE